MQLISDVVSYGKNKTVYGKAKDKVKVIRQYGEVMIVENLKGERFPVRIENLHSAPDRNNIR